MNGTDARKLIVDAKLKFWQVADAFGVADTTFSRYMRDNHEFSDEDAARLIAIVDTLKAKK